MELRGKVVLITGARGGLGTFVTNSFLDAGASVIGVSRSISDADFPREGFMALPAELTGVENARQVVDAAIAKTGRIDGLIHLTGGFAGGEPVSDTDEVTLDRMLDLNFRSAFYVIRAILPSMRDQGGGRIIAIGSKAAVEPSPMAGVYAASKAALVSLIRTVARENSDQGISANIVLPGTMDTPANRAADPKADTSKWIHPCQIAALLMYLMSCQAALVNGAVIPAYGREA
jgi:NAD(P)-dependent dehydrogenase (short-subunit alcohol dehydrogenase family)